MTNSKRSRVKMNPRSIHRSSSNSLANVHSGDIQRENLSMIHIKEPSADVPVETGVNFIFVVARSARSVDALCR